MLGTFFLVLQMVGFLVVCWSGYCFALGTYSKSCETIQKKLLMR